jgi:hypothetical protein
MTVQVAAKTTRRMRQTTKQMPMKAPASLFTR